MRIYICTAVLIFLVLALCIKAEEPRGTPATKEREAAIAKAIDSIRKFKPTEDTPRALKDEFTLKEMNKKVIQYGVMSNSGTGLIEFDNNEWIYIATHSWHLDDKIGDVSVAIDNKGNIYLNEGHVCGGINFVPSKFNVAPNEDIPAPASVKEFIDNYVSWIDGKPWKLLDEKPAWVEFKVDETGGNVGTGMTYRLSVDLKIYTNGEWTCLTKRLPLMENAGSFEIESKGTSAKIVGALQEILKETDILNSKNIEGQRQRGRSREGSQSEASSTIVIREGDKKHVIEWPGFGMDEPYISLELQQDKKNVKNLFFFLRNRVPYMPVPSLFSRSKSQI